MWPSGTAKPGRRSWPAMPPTCRPPPGADRLEVERARVGDGPRVGERLGVAAQSLAQDRLVLQPVLAVRLEPVPRVVERDAEIDAAQHVVQAPALRARVMDVVRDHRAEALLRGELRERVAQRGVVGIEVVRKLDEAALAEDRREP